MLCHLFSSAAAAAAIHGRLHPYQNPNPNSPLLSPLHALEPTHTPPPDTSHPPRRQNARSASLLHRHPLPNPDNDNDEHLLLLHKKAVEEASLATRRSPRFPGSVDFPGTDRLHPPPPPSPHLALGGNDLPALRRALDLRRAVAAEILRAALRASKLSINYSNNLVSRLPDFVDRVVIGAASLKENPDLSHLSFNTRAKIYIHNTGVVALVKWLKHNHLTFHQIGKVICLCSGDLQEVRRVCEWMKTIHVRGESLGIVLVKAGRVWERSSVALEEIVEYLEDHGVRRDWVGYVVGRCPQVLAQSTEELEARVKFYLDMGLSDRDFGTMVFDYPRVLAFYSLDEMNSKVNYLKEFGLNTEDVGRLLAFRPQLMGCSIDERWKPLVKYMYYLGISRDGMKRILTIKPIVFCVDLETTIAPKVRFLQDIGVRQEAVGNMLVKFPHLLTYSLYRKIRPVIIFLMTKGGVTQKDIAKVIALDPQLVGCSIVDKLEVNISSVPNTDT